MQNHQTRSQSHGPCSRLRRLRSQLKLLQIWWRSRLQKLLTKIPESLEFAQLLLEQAKQSRETTTLPQRRRQSLPEISRQRTALFRKFPPEKTGYPKVAGRQVRKNGMKFDEKTSVDQHASFRRFDADFQLERPTISTSFSTNLPELDTTSQPQCFTTLSMECVSFCRSCYCFNES